MVFLNHHYKPSLFNILYFRMLKAKVMDCGLFSLFEYFFFLCMHVNHQNDNISLQSHFSPFRKRIKYFRE